MSDSVRLLLRFNYYYSLTFASHPYEAFLSPWSTQQPKEMIVLANNLKQYSEETDINSLVLLIGNNWGIAQGKIAGIQCTGRKNGEYVVKTQQTPQSVSDQIKCMI